MAKVKQEITSKKKATNKNKKSKYTYKVSRTSSQTSKDNNETKKYAYTKKITTNGKTRYYYA